MNLRSYTISPLKSIIILVIFAITIISLGQLFLQVDIFSFQAQLAGISSISCYFNTDCQKNQFCGFPAGTCRGPGQCVTKPEMCFTLYEPVCGCDDKTYSNDCFRKMAGVAKKHDGKCKYPYPPSKILHFNPSYNSGWVYIAQTVPSQGLAFWVAIIRSSSTEPIDTSAQLLYGITNQNTGEYYSGFIPQGSFSEQKDKVNLYFQRQEDGKKLVEFRQTQEYLTEFQLKVNLPWKGGWYQTTRTLPFKRPIIYESGDGVIPMGGGINSLYVSLVPEGGFWVDFQKFNQSLSSQTLSQSGISRGVNHRWGSFILNKAAGTLPAGTVGVYWEILDEKNLRQPGGYTNFDLLIPGQPQKTQENFEIEEIEYWKSPYKTYLKQWRIIQKDLGVDLIFNTLIPDQEHDVIPDNYFYEGMVEVLDPLTKGLLGTGMLEQTHNEAKDKIIPSLVESFETGFGSWLPDHDYGAPVFDVSVSNDQAYHGRQSVRMYIDGMWDDGTAWIERIIKTTPNAYVTLNLDFWLWSRERSDFNSWHVVAYVGTNDPEREEDFTRIGKTDQVAGWKLYSYQVTKQADQNGQLWVALGISCVYEVQKAYYVDYVSIGLLK